MTVRLISSFSKHSLSETRLSLIDRNFKVLESVLVGMKPLRLDGILVHVANPIDVLTYFA